MNSKIFTSRFWLFSVMILAAAFTRLIPHPPNFTAVGAIALFGGAYFSEKKFAFIVPLAAMLISDLIIGFHNGMFSVYLSFVLIVGIGILLSQKIKFKNVVSSITSIISFIFYSNKLPDVDTKSIVRKKYFGIDNMLCRSYSILSSYCFG